MFRFKSKHRWIWNFCFFLLKVKSRAISVIWFLRSQQWNGRETDIYLSMYTCGSFVFSASLAHDHTPFLCRDAFNYFHDSTWFITQLFLFHQNSMETHNDFVNSAFQFSERFRRVRHAFRRSNVVTISRKAKILFN